MGYWMQCCALGRNVQSRALVEGQEVVCYGVTGRRSLGSNPAMVYMMKDSVIIKTGKIFDAIAKRQEIELCTPE